MAESDSPGATMPATKKSELIWTTLHRNPALLEKQPKETKNEKTHLNKEKIKRKDDNN